MSSIRQVRASFPASPRKRLAEQLRELWETATPGPDLPAEEAAREHAAVRIAVVGRTFLRLAA